ncbi:hypothetical protein G6F43_000086 [Rhizopus delemar]|nr:hypothetical protein G6F43_000086 [Rhizopus delemar]
MSSDSPRLFNTKYNATAGRNSHARQRMLSNKISAPLPINLPSLRSETGTESPPAVVPTTVAHNWGSPNPAVSPETSQPDVVVSRAWAVPSSNTDAVSDQLDFPTAAEAVKNTEEKHTENLKPPRDSGRLSWDEMVNDDTEEFSVDVIEFEDGARFPLYDVSPSDRFTEDYDRSYPPQMKPTPREEETKPTPYPFDRGSSWGRNRRQSNHDRKPFSVLQKSEQASAVAERAQKRREEQEASFEAARERARQKADTLGAAMGEKREEIKTRTVAEDEEAWSTYVEDLKKSKVLSKTPVSGVSTWTDYATRLHQSTLNERNEKMTSAPAAEIASTADPVIIKQTESAHPHSPASQSSPSTWDAFVQEEMTKETIRSGRASPAWDTFVSDELQKSGSSQESSSSFGGRRRSAASTVNTHRRFDDQWANHSPRRASSPHLLNKSDQWPHLASRGQRRPSGGEAEIGNKRTSRPYRPSQQTLQREDYKPFTKMNQDRSFASHDSSLIEGKRSTHPPRSFVYGRKKKLNNDFAESDWSEGKKDYHGELIEGEGPVHASKELVEDDRSVSAFGYKMRESKGPIAIMKKPEERKSDSQAVDRRKSTEILWWSEQHQPTGNSMFRTERGNVPRWLTARGKNPFWTFADPVLPFQSDYPIPNEYNRSMGRGKGKPAEAYAQNKMPLVTSILQHERSQKRLDTMTNDMTEDAVETTQTLTDNDAPAYKTKILDMFKNYQSPIFPQAIQKKIGEKPSNLSFMLDKESSGSVDNNAKHCYKNCTDWRNISKGNEHIPLMVYTFPEAVETKCVGVYLMPAKLLPQYQSQALSSAIPLPRQMMV